MYTVNQMMIAYSTFTENNAQQGAALYLEGGAFVQVHLASVISPCCRLHVPSVVLLVLT